MSSTEESLERIRNLIKTLETGHMSHLNLMGKQVADIIRVVLGEK